MANRKELPGELGLKCPKLHQCHGFGQIKTPVAHEEEDEEQNGLGRRWGSTTPAVLEDPVAVEYKAGTRTQQAGGSGLTRARLLSLLRSMGCRLGHRRPGPNGDERDVPPDLRRGRLVATALGQGEWGEECWRGRSGGAVNHPCLGHADRCCSMPVVVDWSPPLGPRRRARGKGRSWGRKCVGEPVVAFSDRQEPPRLRLL
ncbi:hypothetical protein E2562_005229 [Oryza meyeriana var. granulata]|uniref:Uncharacterized protein n=1 Tax=Oryza meyeriana var. granulata TaxID=110450 RepID=A0A6G1EDT1_9ORYZ|nr:hypothetical protein E2562_005229 [Oryza meyeriana var. granulata]